MYAAGRAHSTPNAVAWLTSALSEGGSRLTAWASLLFFFLSTVHNENQQKATLFSSRTAKQSHLEDLHASAAVSISLRKDIRASSIEVGHDSDSFLRILRRSPRSVATMNRDLLFANLLEASDVAEINGGIKLRKEWVDWTESYPSTDVSFLPVEKIPFMPSPGNLDVPLLLLPADFERSRDANGNANGALPRPFRRNPSKLVELAKFNGSLLLARLRLGLDREESEDEWRSRIQTSISLPTIRQVYPQMPQSIIDSPSSSSTTYPQSAYNVLLAEFRRVHAAANWIITQAKTRSRGEIMAPLAANLTSYHSSLQAYLRDTAPRAILPDIQPIFRDLVIFKTGQGEAKREAAASLRALVLKIRQALREVPDYFAQALMHGTWDDNEMEAVVVAIQEFGGEDGGPTTL